MNGTGRVAIVTGAARGIGAATVQALAADGSSVHAVDRAADDPAVPYPLGTAAELAAVVDSAGTPDRVQSHVADVRDVASLEAAIAAAKQRWGQVDAAVACAGVVTGGVPLWQMPLDQQQAVVDINLGGVLSLARAAIPALLRFPEPRAGRFLAVASAARGLPMLAAYCAAKAGVAGLIRALGTELGGTDVTANAVSPGSTQTPMLDESARLYDLADAQAFATTQPIQRLLDPAEVAEVLVFLAGAVIPLNGGLAL